MQILQEQFFAANHRDLQEKLKMCLDIAFGTTLWRVFISVKSIVF